MSNEKELYELLISSGAYCCRRPQGMELQAQWILRQCQDELRRMDRNEKFGRRELLFVQKANLNIGMETNAFLYRQEQEKSDLSCLGCCFNTELSKQITKKGQVVGRTGAGIWACFSPSTEPYASCKKNHVIFTKGDVGQPHNHITANAQQRH